MLFHSLWDSWVVRNWRNIKIVSTQGKIFYTFTFLFLWERIEVWNICLKRLHYQWASKIHESGREGINVRRFESILISLLSATEWDIVVDFSDMLFSSLFAEDSQLLDLHLLWNWIRLNDRFDKGVCQVTTFFPYSRQDCSQLVICFIQEECTEGLRRHSCRSWDACCK